MTAPQKPREGSTLVISWGPSGGLYFERNWCVRLCLWRLAFTWIPQDFDVLFAGSDFDDLVDVARGRRD